MSDTCDLCSACLSILQLNLEEAAERTLYQECKHHATYTDFREAVVHKCVICVRLWESISEESLAEWSKNSQTWKPFRCWLERRPWAPEWYGAIYWHFIYLVFDTGVVDVKYRGNVFCFLPSDGMSMFTWRSVFITFTYIICIGNKPESEDKGRDFELSTSSVKVHELAYEWYKACCKSHNHCRHLSSQSKFAPSRLIDVGVEGESNWRLCLCPEDVADPPDYMTLSYRWAQNPAVVLRSSTIEDFRRGSPIDGLPKTFREAITVARRFSVRYLWIDSLCIVQDSSEDWARESLQMHEIYTNSCCTIAASASNNPDEGLFRSRVAKDVFVGYVKMNFADGSPKKIEIWDQFYMNRLTQGPLTNRGWVFQERVLSPRVLHFSQSQVIWECFEMNKCETFPRFSPYPSEARFERGLKTVDAFFESADDQDDKTMSVNVYSQWNHLVKNYSRCALTRPDDRLIAMSGIAAMFKKNSGDEYLAGLWRSRLVEGLNWVVTDPVKRPENWPRVPSWSWAAVDSAVLPQSTNLPRDDDLVEIISAAVEETPTTCIGWRHIRGAIEVRGCLTKATVFGDGNSQTENTLLNLVGLACRFFAYPDAVDTKFQDGMVLYLLPLRSTLRRLESGEAADTTTIVIIEGMIMESASEAGDSYRRIGHFVVDSLDHVEFFGLLAIPPYSGAKPTKVIADGTKTSVITMV